MKVEKFNENLGPDFEFLFKEKTYKEKVCDSIVNIAQQEKGISEKSFKLLDELIANVKTIYNDIENIDDILTEFETNECRVDFAAEFIYYQIKNLI